ncbi:MAG: helix-turn-helix transcriptional regulator [Nitrospinae bacterium]|nr:helix-turn-helix transcriptional regulator [Nitrospinota bacterium]
MAKFKPVAHDTAFVRRVMKKTGVEEAYDALGEEYALLRELLHARRKAGLSQDEVARRMGAQRPAVTRIETSLATSKHSPSLSTLRKYAVAVGCRLEVRLVPERIHPVRSALAVKRKAKK